MHGISVAEAKAHLTRLLHQVETGEAVHITRRGQAVAVLLSEAEYERLQKTAQTRNFWEQIQEMRADPAFEGVELSPEEVESWRHKESGREFSWEG
jgi:prevent-host-death family protein